MRALNRICGPLLLCVALTSGCLRVQQSLNIAEDGSGEIELDYSVTEQSVRQFDAMRKLQGQLAKAAGDTTEDAAETRYAYMFLMPVESQLRAECERYKPLGITLNKLKVTSSGQQRKVEMRLTFTSLEGLAKAEPFKYVGFSLSQNPQGNYVFHRASAPKPGLNAADFENTATLRMLSPILAGFRVSIQLKTPGKIIKTNAPQKAAYTSVWTYDFERDPAAVAKIQSAQMVTIFEGSGLKLPEIRQP